MKYLLFLAFLPISAFAQSIVGQATFTEPQRNLMNDRMDAGGLYVDLNANGSGFYSDGDHIYFGAQNFAANPILYWTFMSTAVPIQDYFSPASPNGFEPHPNNVTNCGTIFDQSGECIEYIHFAALISYIWNGRSDIVTFNGVTQSKDAHAQDLAEAVWDVIVTAHNRPELDYGDTARYVRNSADGNPHFQAQSKISKYLASYSIIQPQLVGYASYTSNFASVEQWFADAADFAYQRALNRINGLFGTGWQNFTPNSYTSTTLYDATNSQPYAFYNSAGVGNTAYGLTWAQASGINNRVLDFVDYVSLYGTLFNNPTYTNFSFDVFRLIMQVGVFADGTYNEWYRSYDGDPTQGFTYTILSTSKLVYMAHVHAVAVENGLAGATDIGKYYDYTTSNGTDELYSSYAGGSTSGGPKGLKLVLENLGRYYRTTANGGFVGTRFAEGGNTLEQTTYGRYRPHTVHVAMANSYYDDAGLNDMWNMATSAGYLGMSWDHGGVTTQSTSAGPYLEHSLGVSWGMSGSIHGGYFAQGGTESVTFSGQAPPPQPPTNAARRRVFYNNFFNN